jgi:hypothetical protein
MGGLMSRGCLMGLMRRTPLMTSTIKRGRKRNRRNGIRRREKRNAGSRRWRR